ncbi:ATP-binding protein [Simiduia sp. 21SJ11W-1]|uniref:ATP-binding protein n=1 Tax=Simiduia sp. 21SJ11W-1 TaxID=2909669 RepID=UPI00209D3B0F|nr:ATP-binding protein [Simiduia sp. 21SJ11W-1]UTA46957.1 ATP-binding protein [Simiduia sp. 21SJ11W-1]
MPVQRSTATTAWPNYLGLTAALSLLGWLGNYTSLPLLFGIDFIFGSIASVLALALLGPAAAIAVAAIASSYTWLLWSHPYAIIIFTAEIAFLSLCYRYRPKMNLVFADVAYWFVIGIPLVLLFYQYFLKLGFDQSLFIGTKQAMNGIFNLLCANLLILFARSRGLALLENSNFCPITIRNLTFNLVLGIVLLVGALPVVINQHQTGKLLEREIGDELAIVGNLIAGDAQHAPTGEDIQARLANLPITGALFVEAMREDQYFSRGDVPPLAHFEAVALKHKQQLTLYKDTRQKSAIQRWNKGVYVYQTQAGGWKINVGKSASTLVTKLQSAKQDAFVLLNVLLALAILLSQILGRIVEAPLLQLRQLTHRIGAEDATLEAESTPSQIKEFKLLFEAFSDMASRLDQSVRKLQEANDTLELRVERRTRDIQRLSMVASTTTNGVTILDNQHNIVWSNRAFHKILLEDNQTVEGADFASLLRIRNTEAEAEFLQNVQHKRRFTQALEVLNAQHEKVWLAVEWITTNQQEHGHDGYIALITDITTERQAADELARYAARLEDINQEQDKARQSAENAARVKSEFLASMSHEIRTPLNGVVGMLGLLQRGEQSEQQAHYTQLALRSAESLLGIINEILDFSKIESGQLALEHLDFDLVKLLAEFAASSSLRAQEKGIAFYLDATALEYTLINSDPSRILQILNNLIGNAIKFTEQGHVQLDVRLVSNGTGKYQLECAVTDTGIGIEQSVLPNLFNAFTQADASTTRKYGGTGLGLAITKQLCELLGGSLTVTSKPGQGSCFTACIPIEMPDNNQRAADAWPELEGQRLVIVDSNAHQRALTERYLQHTGATIAAAEEFPESFSPEPQWLILCPESITALEAQHADGKLRQCRALVLCSHATRADLVSLGHWQNVLHLSTPLTGLSGKELTPENVSAHDKTDNLDKPYQYVGRLLLVEDNHVNQELARTLLEDMGYHVSMAGNGAEALDHLMETPRQDAFDLVLMDCQMPEMDGYTATRLIRNGKAGSLNADIPIIAMTANAMKGDREQCIAAGMNDYISKPLDFDVVEQVLSTWMANSQRYKRRMPELVKGNEIAQGEANLATGTQPLNDAAENRPVEKPDASSAKEDTVQGAPVWDKAEALKRVRQREDRLVSLVELFVRDMPARYEKMEAQMQDNNLESIQHLAHEIKGVAGNISTKSLYNTARNLETACKEQRDVKAHVDLLKTEMAAAQSTLETYLAEQRQQA